MRNLLFILALLFANCSFAQFVDLKFVEIEPANTIATYSLKYQQDSTNPSDIRSSTYLLFIGNTVSKYVSRASYIIDTTTRKFTSSKQVIDYLTDPQVPKGPLIQIFKNYPKEKLTFINHIPSDTYKFEESLDAFHWVLTGDTSKVCGYKAQKAVSDFGGRSWIAWFSPEIPYSDGPYKFNGLPGLILKVFDTRNHYVFEMISIVKPEKKLMIDIEDKKYIVTTKQGFFHAEDYFREDIVNRAKEAGADNLMQQMAAKNMAVRNNPIELQRK